MLGEAPDWNHPPWPGIHYGSPPGHPFPIVSCFVSSCVSSDISFPSGRQKPTFGPWRVSPFLQQVCLCMHILISRCVTVECVWIWKKKVSVYGNVLQVSVYGDVLKTGTYMNFIMYLCVWVWEWCIQMCHSPEIHRTRRMGEGVARGNLIGTEGRRNFLGRLECNFKVWMSISTISRYIQCSRYICEGSESLISRYG